MFMHIGGSGDEERLAAGVGRVFARMKETAGGAGEMPRGGIDPAKGPVTAARIDAILGRTGTVAAGVYKVVIGRTARMHGAEVGAAMGVNTWAAFAGSDERAVVDGDFAMLESELQPVLKALRRAGILVVAIHHHMTHEEPRMVFLHYWGTGRAEDLAMGLKAALDATGGDRRAGAGGVVFVCEHGSVKSLIAAEWFNRLAKGRGLAVRAVSRGLTPEAAVPPVIVGARAGDGFDVHGYAPRGLLDADLAGAARVVSLGAALERPGVAVERWDAIPPATERYEESRTAIRQRVEELLDRIQSGR
jgi:protein-tyrosine-phosphatase